MTLFVLTAGALFGLHSAVPTFPSSWYAGAQSTALENQGGTKVGHGACCSKSDPSCKVQYQSLGMDVYERSSTNQTRRDSIHGQIVNWGGSVQKQMGLAPGSMKNSSHAFVCFAACPLQGAWLSDINLGSPEFPFGGKPKDKGRATITQTGAPGNATKVTEWYQWKDGLIIVPFETYDFFIDETGSKPVPFLKSVHVTPFAGPELEQINSSYIMFQAINADKYFDIDPASVASCPAPKGGCQQSGAIAESPAEAFKRYFGTSYLEGARAMLNASAAAPTAIDDAQQRAGNTTRFPGDYVSHEVTEFLIKQNGVPGAASGDVCCDGSAPQCQLQMQNGNVLRYVDTTNQRARADDSFSGTIFVDDFHTHTSMSVKVVGGVEACVEFCPIDPADTMKPYALHHDAKDLGKTTLDGKTVEHYQWSQVVLKVIKMSTTDLYTVKQAGYDVPAFQSEQLTPGGIQPPFGTSNKTWSAVKLGPPPAAKFQIVNATTCPQSKKCGSSVAWQAHRIASGQQHTFWSHISM